MGSTLEEIRQKLLTKANSRTSRKIKPWKKGKIQPEKQKWNRLNLRETATDAL